MKRYSVGIDRITIQFLHECFSLDADRGVLVWKTRPDSHFTTRLQAIKINSGMAGKIAGYKTPQGYLRVQIQGRGVMAHRIIYAMFHMLDLKDVPKTLDHIDGCRTNNIPSNLREATTIQNAMNRGIPSHNTSGVKGAKAVKNGKWYSGIRVADHFEHLGTFETKEEAGQAYENAAKRLHGEFFRKIEKTQAAA